MSDTQTWFENARFGIFIHYGLYSLLERGEWALNREQIPLDEYRALSQRFTAERFDAQRLCDLIVAAGARYLVFTTMHHDGFRLYESSLSDFNTQATAAKRDLIAEVVSAARQRGLRIGLYHSLNNWTDQPDAVDALENERDRKIFVDRCHARLREIVERFKPIDVLWYDGWWPFDGEGWRGQEMNAMVRSIQPHILLNGRNGIPGDFATPEGHLTAPNPWRPWEACVTLNNSWCYHRGDHDWKSPQQIIDMLAACSAKQGNLLLNISPRGDGSLPPQCVSILEQVGAWVRRYGRCVFDTDRFTFDLRERGKPGENRADWCYHGPMTAGGNSLYILVRRWPGPTLVLSGLRCKVLRVRLLNEQADRPFEQSEGKLSIRNLPENPPDPICPVLQIDCDRPPEIYMTGGMREPRGPHPRYDPCPSDMPS